MLPVQFKLAVAPPSRTAAPRTVPVLPGEPPGVEETPSRGGVGDRPGYSRLQLETDPIEADSADIGGRRHAHDVLETRLERPRTDPCHGGQVSCAELGARILVDILHDLADL
jgi:hypothetical protein